MPPVVPLVAPCIVVTGQWWVGTPIPRTDCPLHRGCWLMVGDTLVTDKGLTFKGALKLGSNAILQLNDAKAEATYTEGDQVRVFTGTATGTFKEIIPATPGEGLEWDTTSLSTGILKVVKSSGTTGISEVKSNNDSPRYNLNGQPVKGQTNGLFIQDGKIRIKK